MNPSPDLRPPRLAAASRGSVELAGAPVSMTAMVPTGTRRLLAGAAGRESARPGRNRPRIYLNVEDIRAKGSPGSVYGVYLNLPPRRDHGWSERVRNHHHIGNVTAFGAEAANDPDPKHQHVPGMRHTFDVTRRVRTLRRSGRFGHEDRVVVTFLLELPLPPPGYRGNADRILDKLVRDAAAAPITVGRVSLFVG